MGYTRNQVLDALKAIRHPEHGQDIITMGLLDDVEMEGTKIVVKLKFPRRGDPFASSVKKSIHRILGERFPALNEVEVLEDFPTTGKEPKMENELKNVENIIAIASGKGGVGKSTVATNLAVALANLGYSVGLLDADIFGPSIPKMFDVMDARPVVQKVDDREMILPIESYGVKMLSIGFFVDKEDATIWRGPMASNFLKQMMLQGDWGKLDYLLVDLPPGTSDIHLTLVQTVAVTGAVIVSTPQEVALADAVKGVSMFSADKINVPVLGLVENMSWFTPAELPDNRYYIFGENGGAELASRLKIDLLGQIPVVQGIREGGDNGVPSALDATSPEGKAFVELAQNLTSVVKKRNKEQPPTHKVEMKS